MTPSAALKKLSTAKRCKKNLQQLERLQPHIMDGNISKRVTLKQTVNLCRRLPLEFFIIIGHIINAEHPSPFSQRTICAGKHNLVRMQSDPPALTSCIQRFYFRKFFEASYGFMTAPEKTSLQLQINSLYRAKALCPSSVLSMLKNLCGQNSVGLLFRQWQEEKMLNLSMIAHSHLRLLIWNWICWE